MMPAGRAALIARAKQVAVPVVSCARAGISRDHITAGLSRDDLLALVDVLAECAGTDRLKAVTRMPGGELMPPAAREEVLRAAHAERTRLTRAGLPVPYQVRALDGEYRAHVRRRNIAAARETSRAA